MNGRAALVFVVLCLLAPATFAQDCKYLAPVSEETSAAVCPAYYAASGINCTGNNCDNIRLKCCRYMPGTDATGQTIPAPPPPKAGDWGSWFSEEDGGVAVRKSNALISGLQCKGSKCDAMSLLERSPYARTGSRCVWLDPVSEEDNRGAECPAGTFVSGMKCSGSYCDNVALQCCNAVDTTDKTYAISPRSCMTLPRTGRGLSAAAEVTPTGLPADLSKARPDWICPSGYAMRGLQCTGSYCSYLNAICCPYLSGEDSSKPTFRVATPFSEENLTPARNYRRSNIEFIVGVRCSGNYCDNVEPAFMLSSLLKNDAATGACRRMTFSEEQRSAQCLPSEFVSGLQCDGSYCDNITLTCCRFSTPLPKANP